MDRQTKLNEVGTKCIITSEVVKWHGAQTCINFLNFAKFLIQGKWSISFFLLVCSFNYTCLAVTCRKFNLKHDVLKQSVVYFDQLSGACSTWSWSNYFFCWFQPWNHWKRFKINEKKLKMAKKRSSTSFQVLQAPKKLVEIHNNSPVFFNKTE